MSTSTKHTHASNPLLWETRAEKVIELAQRSREKMALKPLSDLSQQHLKCSVAVHYHLLAVNQDFNVWILAFFDFNDEESEEPICAAVITFDPKNIKPEDLFGCVFEGSDSDRYIMASIVIPSLATPYNPSLEKLKLEMKRNNVPLAEKQEPNSHGFRTSAVKTPIIVKA